MINNYINGDCNDPTKTDYFKKYAASTDHYGLAEHIKYLHSTKQYEETPRMVDDRLNKTLNLLESYGLNKVSVVKKNTAVEPLECHFGDKYEPLDGDLWIQTTGEYTNHDPIWTNIANQAVENTDTQLSFLNLDSTYYPVSNPNSLVFEMPASTPLMNNYLEPYVMPSYTLIDFSKPSYIEPYNFSLDNYNSNNYYFDITNYQIPIDSNFGLGNSNWGGGGYFGGYGGYGGGGNYFFSMHAKESVVDIQLFKNNDLPKPCLLNDIVDLEISENDSLSVLLKSSESPTVNKINTLNTLDTLDTLDKDYWSEPQETMTLDPLRDFFELASLT